MIRSLILRGTLAALALALAFTSARAQTFFQYVSQPGDTVGGGNSATITSANAEFRVGPNGTGGVYVEVLNNGGGVWNLEFSTQFATPLTTGTYVNATLYPWNASFAPGMEVWSTGHNQSVLGDFVVSELAFDASHHLSSFAVDFDQHSGGATAALFGALRYNSNKPVLISRFANSGAQASFAFVSESGDPVGNGASGFFEHPPDDFEVTSLVSGELRVLVTGAGHSNYDWVMLFDPGDGNPVSPGVYSGCTKYPNNPFPSPGILVVDPSQSDPCSTATGLFRVGAFQLDANHRVVKLELDFNYHCGGGGPAFVGSIRVGSNAPVSADEFLGDAFAETYCFGVACPCGSDNALGGCRNSTGGGATLTVQSGSASIAAADLSLATYGLPPGQPALLLASANVSATPFGAGTLCVGGALVRLAVDQHPLNGSASFTSIIPRLGLSTLAAQVLAGSELRFQTWYRDPHANCAATHNLSNALQVRLEP